MEFKDFLADALKKNPELELALIEEFELGMAGVLTVKKWANGTARPHPLFQEMIRKFIFEKTAERAK
ncbi:MAG: hypothetical protein Q7S36_00590 [Candidatus Liptonbacteria bacterium]|nr:hypothetical protein [Candidatus Liptonbacteria bacterium]